tara:strand:+ start:169 stop:456 length:288 start_codon:yes stop_codon:yes gene_type:complete
MAYRMKGFSGFSDLIQDAAMMTGKKVKEIATAMRDGSLVQETQKDINKKRIEETNLRALSTITRNIKRKRKYIVEPGKPVSGTSQITGLSPKKKN